MHPPRCSSWSSIRTQTSCNRAGGSAGSNRMMTPWEPKKRRSFDCVHEKPTGQTRQWSRGGGQRKIPLPGAGRRGAYATGTLRTL
eukprot:5059380-Prymnesium_polylepis.1